MKCQCLGKIRKIRKNIACWICPWYRWVFAALCININPDYKSTGNQKILSSYFCTLFVLMFYCQVNPVGSCQVGSVYLTTHLLGRQSSKLLTSILHFLSPETDNCTSWIIIARMTEENISRSISMKECCWPSGGQTHNFLITSRLCIQLSYQNRHYFCT